MKKNETSSTWFEKPRLVCGLMSGTSLDGIDAAIVKIWIEDGKHHFDLISFLSNEYSDEVKEVILGVTDNISTCSSISALNFKLSELYADAVIDACNSAGIKLENLDAVGMHGQTVWHDPFGALTNRNTPSTLQLGSVSALANILGVPVVGDFRSADIVLGGQGAPLVPIFDFNFLSEKENDVIALNIGGISNITILPANCKQENIIAFDTGPGNVLIDTYMRKFFDKEFDASGKTASSGKLISKLFDDLKELDYISLKLPKSTGRELFNEELIEGILSKNNLQDVSNNDLIHTLTKFTAWSIAENIRLFANEKSKIIISGGGVHNDFLIKLLVEELPNANIFISNDVGISADAKEAICFAYLAWRTLAGLYSNIPSVTGAAREAVLGVIAVP